MLNGLLMGLDSDFFLAGSLLLVFAVTICGCCWSCWCSTATSSVGFGRGVCGIVAAGFAEVASPACSCTMHVWRFDPSALLVAI
ncbi:hypothetical protein Nepgr_016349 [Nepenthes gracilis]|uniref:Uncharacterized protein n=1 Tax=Nepenthes gracilis TaxID=150966 RepID=A0AAD3SMJ3_NEPGR|nr:hypothetical protein Nepgr_016349 [Nepenthes gracilis]